MHHHPVKSSRIISVAYDDASATLEIYFYHQPPLQYTGVPPRIFHDFLQVMSKCDCGHDTKRALIPYNMKGYLNRRFYEQNDSCPYRYL